MARDGFGVAKSSVSREFVRASAADVKALAERRFDGERFPVVMIDGVEYAGETMVVALGITEDGTKRILGLRQGATENAEVCTALLEDLRGRGLDTSRPTLLVLDGSKALHAAVTRVWGANAVIQRCQVHKRRNVKAHVPEKHHAELERRLSEAYHETDYDDGQDVAGGDGAVARAAQPGRGVEPAGGPGGDADGGAAGRAGGAAADAGDDQPDRVRAVGDAASDGPGDALA